MTTHYEKIQALGNRMASNLETMGVSASFSDGGLTLADKILQIQHFTNGLLLYADKDIIQTGDTVNVYALLLDERKAVSGETILFNGLETTQTLVANTETSVGNQYKFINLPTMTDFSQRVYLNEEQTIHITKGQQDTNYYIWIPGTPSGYFVPIDTDSDIIVENGVIKLKSNHSDWTYDASATNTNKITSTISDVTIAETMQATTGSNGVATVSYTGKGAGVLNIKAVHGIIQSETYDILDCIVYDVGTSQTAPWRVIGTGTLSQENDYRVFNDNNVSSGAVLALAENSSTNKQLPASIIVEMDIKRIDGSASSNIITPRPNGMTITSYSMNSNTLGLTDNNWHTIKIKLTPSTVSKIENDVETVIYNVTHTVEYWIFCLWTALDITTIHFKNLRIYPI